MKGRRRRVLVLVLTFSIPVIAIGALVVPLHRSTEEFSGSCGRFRSCRSGFLGFGRTCSIHDDGTDWGLKPFAPAESCDGDWEVISSCTYTLGSVGCSRGRSGGPAAVIFELRRIARTQQMVRAKWGRYEPIMPGEPLGVPPSPFQASDCAGQSNSLTDDSFRVVWARDAGGGADCWSLSSDGDLRHLADGRSSAR